MSAQTGSEIGGDRRQRIERINIANAMIKNTTVETEENNSVDQHEAQSHNNLKLRSQHRVELIKGSKHKNQIDDYVNNNKPLATDPMNPS